jgi:hypothetical protein
MRVLAGSFDVANTRDELLEFAKRCGTLATSIEKLIRESLSAPIDRSSKDPTGSAPC